MTPQDKHIYINIYLHGKEFVPAGVITFNETEGYSSFSYFSTYIEQNLPPLNPSTLNWRENNQKHFIVDPTQNNQMLDRTFWEMLPNQNDWGHQVLSQRYPEYENLNNAQKLYFLHYRTVGGLNSYTDEQHGEENIIGIDWLDKIRDQSVDLYLKRIENISYIKAINPLSSYGGVRPKCMFEDDNGDFWIAKFNVPNDPYDMAKVEQVAMDMARDIGLETAESKILELPSGENVFLSKRFDRKGDHRFHSLSLFALSPGNQMVKNPNAPGNPSSFIQRLIRRYSDFENMDTLNIVLKMLLDIGVNNTDNHLRNLRVILNENNKWQLSPIYDVILNPFSQNHVYNPAGLPLNELYLANPKLASSMGKELGIDPKIIEDKIHKIVLVIENWESYCDKYNMSVADKEKVANSVMLGLYRQEIKKKSILSNNEKLKIHSKLTPRDR
jgi:serine/threonine-protein kinase HipA